MDRRIKGIHHVTAIATEPGRNHDFYSGLLGLRLVKKTVNFDDPQTYHLYYGDESGRPGTILTFFPWPGARRGSLGSGQVTTTALAVPAGSLESWGRRLSDAGVPHEDPARRFGDRFLRFVDPDGLRLELVEDEGVGDLAPWADGPLGEDVAVRGIHSTTLTVRETEASSELLTTAFGARPAAEDGARRRFLLADSDLGARLDLFHRPGEGQGRIAAGSVHHVAFRTADDEEQARWREDLLGRGLHVTPIQDRRYFRSIYFREPGGVLFEIATDPPGFTRDEPIESLGSDLKLPPWLEGRRSQIESSLPSLAAREAAAR